MMLIKDGNLRYDPIGLQFEVVIRPFSKQTLEQMYSISSSEPGIIPIQPASQSQMQTFAA
jgi:hypothetical protein